jgi:hypothetical protein
MPGVFAPCFGGLGSTYFYFSQCHINSGVVFGSVIRGEGDSTVDLSLTVAPLRPSAEIVPRAEDAEERSGKELQIAKARSASEHEWTLLRD